MTRGALDESEAVESTEAERTGPPSRDGDSISAERDSHRSTESMPGASQSEGESSSSDAEERRGSDAEEGRPPDVEGRVTTTGRWAGVQALAVGAIAVAILVGSPAALLAGVAGVGFAASATAFDPPVATVAVERRVSDPEPDPGERVRVTLTVRNEGENLLPDFRFADGVPAGLVVVDGTARRTTALRPGKEATIEYEVRAVRGRHEFDDLTAVSRDVSGARQWTATISTERTAVYCRPRYETRTPALDALATRLVGRHDSDATGEGVAFHSVREYRTGDAPSRIDWNRYAKTGDLSTRRYEQPRRRTAVLVVDARAEAYVTDGSETPAVPAVDECVRAAGALAGSLLDRDVRVGLTALGPERCWISPGTGRGHRRRVHEALTARSAFDWEVPSADEGGFDRVVDRLPAHAVAVVFSPCTDAAVARHVRELRARNHDVALVSPTVDATDTPERRVATLERDARLRALRDAGVTVHEIPTRGDESGEAAP